MAAPSGVLLVAKPEGPTSHAIVEEVRRAYGCKAGHAGTLDPFASGLLLVLVERATRVQRALTNLTKEYHVTARFGARSDTGDPKGNVESTGLIATENDLQSVLEKFTGVIRQRVPMTSAVKVGGERLYRKARRGENIETPLRTINIEGIKLCSFSSQRAYFKIRCSKGTYIRQLIMDIGEAVEAGAFCEQLVRTAVGPWGLDQAVSMQEIEAANRMEDMDAFKPMTIHIGDMEIKP